MGCFAIHEALLFTLKLMTAIEKGVSSTELGIIAGEEEFRSMRQEADALLNQGLIDQSV